MFPPSLLRGLSSAAISFTSQLLLLATFHSGEADNIPINKIKSKKQGKARGKSAFQIRTEKERVGLNREVELESDPQSSGSLLSFLIVVRLSKQRLFSPVSCILLSLSQSLIRWILGVLNIEGDSPFSLSGQPLSHFRPLTKSFPLKLGTISGSNQFLP